MLVLVRMLLLVAHNCCAAVQAGVCTLQQGQTTKHSIAGDESVLRAKKLVLDRSLEVVLKLEAELKQTRLCFRNHAQITIYTEHWQSNSCTASCLQC